MQAPETETLASETETLASETETHTSMAPVLIGIVIIVILLVVAIIGWALGWFSGGEKKPPADEDKKGKPIVVDPNSSVSERIDQLVTTLNGTNTNLSALSEKVDNISNRGGETKAFFNGYGQYGYALPKQSVVTFPNHTSNGGIVYSEGGLISGLKPGKTYEINMTMTLKDYDYKYSANFIMENGDGSKKYENCRARGYASSHSYTVLAGGHGGCIIQISNDANNKDLELRLFNETPEDMKMNYATSLIVKEI